VLDYDNDGWQEYFACNSMDWPGHASKEVVFRAVPQRANGTFKDVTKEAGLAVAMYGLGCAVGDYDNDGVKIFTLLALDGNHLFHKKGMANLPT